MRRHRKNTYLHTRLSVSYLIVYDKEVANVEVGRYTPKQLDPFNRLDRRVGTFS